MSKFRWMKIVNLFLLVLVVNSSFSKQFVNGDLEGTISWSQVPLGWSSVPHTDLHSIATSANGASPDILSIDGPGIGIGAYGYASSGQTFVMGNMWISSSGAGNHEGIMQTVNGLMIDTT